MPLDAGPRISIIDVIRPAGAEIDVFPIILVLVDDLIRVSLAGITAGVDLLAFAVPATANLDEIITPGRVLAGLLLSLLRIVKEVFYCCFHLVLPL